MAADKPNISPKRMSRFVGTEKGLKIVKPTDKKPTDKKPTDQGKKYRSTHA